MRSTIGVIPLARFFLLAGLVWLGAWLPIGLWIGDLDYVLTAVSRGTVERQIYQGLFYSGLLVVFLNCWRRYAPVRPEWGRPSMFGLYLVQGLLASIVLRLVLWGAGLVTWRWLDLTTGRVLEILVGCLAVALIEEAIFRGFLLGRMIERLGWSRGVVVTSLLFASVHLFRPGPWTFKLSYGLGLFALGVLLSHIAWRHNSIFASAGFHAGLIFFNLATVVVEFKPSIWSGDQMEPVAGLVSLLLTLMFYGIWLRLVRVPTTSKDHR